MEGWAIFNYYSVNNCVRRLNALAADDFSPFFFPFVCSSVVFSSFPSSVLSMRRISPISEYGTSKDKSINSNCPRDFSLIVKVKYLFTIRLMPSSVFVYRYVVKRTETVQLTITARPRCFPGSHFGDMETILTASSSRAGSTPRRTFTSLTDPSALTLN